MIYIKLLKIYNGVGSYIINDKEKNIDLLTKEDILVLVKQVIEDETAELDEYKDELILNSAHKIIYKSVYSKLKAIKTERLTIISNTENIFKDAESKYKNAN